MVTRKIDIEDISGSYANAAEAVDHAIMSLSALLSAPRYSVRQSPETYAKLRRDLPYVIHTTGMQGKYILVNRNYKPVGSNSPAHENWVDYDKYNNLHIRVTPEQIASVVTPGHEFGLFADENPPWISRNFAEAYLHRLQKLLAFLTRQQQEG